jgi:L-lactate utilization protein LutB
MITSFIRRKEIGPVTSTAPTTDQTVFDALAKRGFRPIHVRNGQEARDAVLDLLPEGALVAHGSSTTLQQIGLVEALQSSSWIRYGNVEWLAETDAAKRTALRKELSINADVYLGSVQALTRAGQAVGADQSGSRQAFYTFGPKKVVWVVGVNKLVDDLEAAITRVYEVALPQEDARVKALGMDGSAVNKLVIYEKEPIPDRVTIVLVDEKLGF